MIRAGFGIYYALLDNLSYRMDQNPPFNTTISIKNASLASLDIVPGAPLPAGGLISPAGFQPDLKTPQILSYNFRIEREIAEGTALALGYVGSRGRHEILSVDADEPAPTFCPAAACPAGLPAGTIYYPKNAPLANPNLANTTSWFSTGDSAYNAFQVDLNHRFDRGLQFRAVYTFSKSLDDGATLASAVGTNAPAFVMFPGNPHLDWGLSTFDVRHSVAVNTSVRASAGPSRQGLRRKAGRRLDRQRYRLRAGGIPVHAAIGLQPVEQRRHAQPGAALLEPRVYRSRDSGRPGPLLRCQRLPRAGQWDLRKRRTRRVGGAWVERRGFLAGQEHPSERSV